MTIVVAATKTESDESYEANNSCHVENSREQFVEKWDGKKKVKHKTVSSWKKHKVK